MNGKLRLCELFRALVCVIVGLWHVESLKEFFDIVSDSRHTITTLRLLVIDQQHIGA